MLRQFSNSLLLALLLLASSHLLVGCVESEFTLAPQSRLPTWFTVPAGLSRSDVSVTLAYYTTGKVRLALADRKGKKIAEIVGESQWHPDTLSKRNKDGGLDANSYPHYSIIRAKSIVEVFEFKRLEPIFYVTDDPRIVAPSFSRNR